VNSSETTAASSYPEDLLPAREAVRLLPGARRGKAVHIATLYRLVHSGRLRAWRVGGRLHVSAAEVRALVEPVTPRGAKGPPGLTRAQEARLTAEVLRRHGLG